MNNCCQAQPQLNSTQLQLQLRLRLAVFPPDPATHPPGTVVFKKVRVKTSSRPIQDNFKTICKALKNSFMTI